MKKVIFSVAVLLGTMTTFAAPVAQNVQLNKVVIVQDEYTEVSLDAVPTAVKSTVETSFPGAKLVKAYTKESKQYKLEIAMGDKSYTVFTDASGKIIKK